MAKTAHCNSAGGRSIELYGIRNWGAGFFTVSDEGDVVVCPQAQRPADLHPEIISGLRERGYDMPVLLRVENILDSRIASLARVPSARPSRT